MPILEIGKRNLLEVGSPAMNLAGAKSHDPIRIVIPEGPQQNGVHHLENSRIRADAQRHNQHHERSESRSQAEIPARVSKVAHKIVCEADTQCVPALFFPLLDTTHGDNSGPAGFGSGQASCDLCGCLFLDVELEFLIEFAFDAIAVKDCAKP
jgi:hypothetical protein